MSDKELVREQAKQIRRQMTAQEAAEGSERIVGYIIESALFQKNVHILGYYPLGKEASVLRVAEEALRQGKQVAFPKVAGADMVFVQVTDLKQFREGAFHIMEPVGGTIVTWEEGLALTPGLAFDRSGARMGHGKGYYDRYFASYPRLIRAGVAFDNQIFDRIPSEAYDMDMQYVCTPEGIWSIA